MAECGTTAGYHAHRRRREDACEDCRGAMAEDKRQQRLDEAARAAASFEDAINNEPEIEPGIDVLRELRNALRIAKAALRVPKSTRDVPALTKQVADLSLLIQKIEADQNKSGGVLGEFDDELADILHPDFSGRNTGT